VASPTPLEARLTRFIAARGPMSFRDFMETALYDPEHGYYAKGPRIGPEGDFYTAASFPLYAWCIATQVGEMWRRLGEPRAFPMVEAGGGTGAFAHAFLDRVDETDEALARALKYVFLERSPGLRARQAAAVPEAKHADDLARYFPYGFSGVLFANELLDAFPVHRVVQTAEGLKELHVTVDESGRLREVALPPTTPLLADYLKQAEVTLARGQQAEINLKALEWVVGLGKLMERGYAILVDYGGSAQEVYGRNHHRGTLVAYREHQVVDDILASPGEQDLTADVDFTSVARAARAAGFEVAYTTQGRFLAALGLLDLGQEAAVRGDMQSALGVKNLLLPTAMGDRFRVLILAKNAPLAGLQGLGDPFGGGFRPSFA